MKKIALISISILLSIFWISCSLKKSDVSNSLEKTVHQDPEGYFTCPMHPEVHEHKPSACPICGMALVKVSNKKVNEDKSDINGVSFSAKQMQLAATSKYIVVKKNLIANIPLSGRIVSSREVSFQVYESDISFIKNGLNFKGTLSSAPDDFLTGKIHHIEHLIDPSSRTISVIGVLDKVTSRTIVDISFYGEVEVKLLNQIAVPEEAIFHTGDRDLVYVFSGDNILQPRPVVVGTKAGNEYQIISGLSENEIISSGANFLIDSEAKIRGANDKTHH